MKHIAKGEERKTIRNLQGINLGLAIVFALTAVSAPLAQAQTFTVLHTFTGGADGGQPYGGLTMDRAGNLYGTTRSGGYTGDNCATNAGCGTVYKLVHAKSGWVVSTLYTFLGNDAKDGAGPGAKVVFGPDGSLYGTTVAGGGGPCSTYQWLNGCGTVFKLTPPATACKAVLCPWTETVLHRFAAADGSYPYSEVVFDASGNLYSTTLQGGAKGFGTVYELTASSGYSSETVLHSFPTGPYDGAQPVYGRLTFDNDGNLYGTAETVVFALMAPDWTESILHQFNEEAFAGVTFDRSGNLFGATSHLGSDQGGSAFELARSESGWTESLLYRFPFSSNGGNGPNANLFMDAAGNLYGTTYGDPGYGCENDEGCGTVFKLTQNPDGTWSNTFLHEFTGAADGANPISDVVFDASGNLYGTAHLGGVAGCEYGNGCGVVWEITP